MNPETILEFCSRTETGRMRSRNEDSVVASPELGLAVVADGMGGYQAGEVASEIAARVITDRVKASLGEAGAGASGSQLLYEAVRAANHEILQAAGAHPEYRGMGTTVVAALFRGRHLSLAHVGDSRAYCWRGGDLRRMSADHSVVQEFVSSGLYSEAEARARFNTNLVTRALGVDADLEVDVADERTGPGDIYLLCSDGLTDMLRDEQIEAVLSRQTDDLNKVADELVDLANQAGGRDNISLILARVDFRGGE